MAASDWVLDAPAPAPTPPVTSPPASDWVLDAPPPASAAPPDDPAAAATSDWVVDPPEKQGFFGGIGSGATSLARETGQLVTGQAFSDANIQPPPERTFMGDVGASLPGMAVIAGAGAAGAGAGSLIGPWGTVAGGVLGAGAAAFAQGLIPAYSEARQRGLSHDDAVSEAYTSAAASGTLTGATVPLFAWAPFKSQVSNLLLHSLTTGPAVGAVQQGIVTPAVTGQPMPSAGEMAEGAAINALGGGMMAAGQHYAPRIAGRLVGRPGETVPPPEALPAPDVNPPGSYGRELFTIPPEGVDPTVTQPEAPPPGTPPGEPSPVTPTTQVEPPPVTVAPPAVPTPIPAEPPVKEPPPDVTRPIAPQPEPEPGAVGAVPVAPVEPAAGVIRPEPEPSRTEPVPGPGPVEPVPEPGAVAPLPRTEPEQPIIPGEAPVPPPVTAPKVEPPAPGSPADILARLDAEKAPDSAYRDALSTGSKEPLKAGETWRDRLVKWADSEKQPLEPAPTPTPSPEPRSVVAAETTVEDLSKRGPGGFRGATRKAPAPGTPEPLPKRVGTQKRYAPTPPPETGRPLTLEDYNYSRDVSMERQGFHDALAGTGEDPRTAANKPMPEQIKMLSNAVADKYKFTDVKVETKPSIYLDKSGKERVSPAVEPRITRDQLLNMHQNMQNVAYAHDWAPEVMSLDGRLNLHLVPRDFQGEHWMGQYSFGPKTIGISGGSNSFAHELWHGIDHYLSDTLNKNPNKQALLSWDGRAGTLDPKADRVQAAFAHMLNTMSHGSGEILQRRLVLERVAQKVNKAGQPTKDAITARQQLDRLNSGATGGLRIPVSDFVKQAQGMQNPRYYASVHELMARMGEAYTAYKAELKGVNTAGVVKPNKAYTDQTIKYLREAYPNPFDRIRNFAAWDNLALEMQHAAVLNHGHAPAQRASDANTLAMWHDRPPDIGPGFVARLKEDAKALLPSRLLGPEHDKLLFPEGRTPRPLTYATKGEVPRPKNLGESAADSLAQIFNSAVGNLHRMIEQAHPNAKPYARQILDRIAVSHGVKTARPMTMFERERTYARADVARTEDQFKDNGLVNRVGRLRTTPLEDSMFWHTLTSGEKTYPLDPFDPGKGRVPIPDKLLAMAEQQRPLLDAIHERAKATGLEVQYRDRYAPRIWDDPRILSDKGGYIKDLTKANRFDMDKDIAGSPERLHQWWSESERAMREDPNLDVIKPGAAAGMEQMGKNYKRIGQIDRDLAAAGTLTAPGASPTTHNPTALRAERDILVRQNQDLYNQFHGAVKDHIAGLEAENRYDAIALGGPSNFETFGPSSKPLRHRTMSPEMDQMMRKWLVQNPRTGLANYYVGMNRKIAYHEVFGKNGEDIEILRRHFVDNGGTREASDLIKNIVELMGGRSLRDNDKATTNVTNLISAMGMLRSLPGASISALGEPFATLLNQGSPRMMFKTFTHLFGQFMGTASGAERMATARAIGAVSPRLMGAAAAGRFSDYSGTPWIANLTNGFFELALSPAIRNIRAAVLGAGTEHMKLLTRLATDPAVTRGQLNRKDDAQRMLRDWGVPDKRFQEFRDWLHQEEGLPSRTRIARDLKDMGGLYRLAANRMLNRFNQDPTAAEKPLASLKSPYMNMATQLTAFPYSFWLNTMEPMLKRASYNRQRQYDRSLAAGATHNEARFQAEVARFGAWSNAAMGATALLAGTGLMSAARTYFLSHDTWKKHEEAGDLGGWLLGNAVSQSGMSGPLDIPNQAFTGLRYHSDLAQLTEGPYLSGDLRFAADIVKGLEGAFGAGPTPQTNTENYNAIYALTQLAVKPGALSGLVWLAERVPAGGPLAALITAASILGTSGTAMRGLTDIAAGERGTKLPKEGAEGDTGEPSLTMPDVSMTDLEQGAESGGANAGGGGGLTNLGVGFLDDLLMPAMRIAPTSLKLGIGGLAAAGGLGGLLKQGQMYKSQGVPPEKVH